jgi:hypothetical protein
MAKTLLYRDIIAKINPANATNADMIIEFVFIKCAKAF